MSSMLEKSLDEIIKDAPRQGGKNFRNNNRPRNGPGGIGKNPRGTRGGRFNSHPRYNNNNGRPHHRSGPPHHNSYRSDYKRPHIPKDHEAEELSQGKSYLRITNLHPDLSETDIRDLFSKIGEVLFCKIKYSTTGLSTGNAFVGFVDPSNCQIAVDKFDGRRAAGQIISVENAVPLSQRIGVNTNNNNKDNRPARNPRGGRRTTKSLEELDAELESYMGGEQQHEQQPEQQIEQQPEQQIEQQPEQQPEQPAQPEQQLQSQENQQQSQEQQQQQSESTQPAFPAVNYGDGMSLD